MAGSKALRVLQLGKETTAGTVAAATTIWRGMGTIQDNRETVFIEEDIGYLSPVDRTCVPKYEAALSMDAVPATFEQVPYVLQAGVLALTPVADTGGSGYISDFIFPTTAKNSFQTFTIEGGDDQAVERIEYAFVNSFTLSGQAGAAWQVSSEWIARQVTEGVSFTGSVAVPDVEEILFLKTKLYIDAVGGTIGTTQKSNTLISATLNVTTGLIPKYTADGELYFSFVQTTASDITLNVTFEHDGTAIAEKTAWRDETPRQIRLLSEGSAFTTAGATYSNKSMIIDLAGKWESFDKLGDQDGNDIVTGTFRARYNSTAALYAKITMVNSLAALA